VSSLWISVAQAHLIVTSFPQTPGCTVEERYREHAIVILFSRIVDLENLDILLDVVPKETRHCLLNRIGWLNALNTYSMDGLYDLDLRLADNRKIAILLTDLAILEPGNNFRSPLFSRRMNTPFIPGWELPASWDEAHYKGNVPPGVPQEGHLVVTLCSQPDQGGGLPNQRLRQKWQQQTLLAVPRGTGEDIHLSDGPTEDWDDMH